MAAILTEISEQVKAMSLLLAQMECLGAHPSLDENFLTPWQSTDPQPEVDDCDLAAPPPGPFMS